MKNMHCQNECLIFIIFIISIVHCTHCIEFPREIHWIFSVITKIFCINNNLEMEIGSDLRMDRDWKMFKYLMIIVWRKDELRERFRTITECFFENDDSTNRITVLELIQLGEI